MQVLTADYTDKNAPQILAESLKETGFAVLTNHPISASLINNVYQEWQNFFASPEKHNYLFDKEVHDGYFPFRSENAKDSPVKDLKEFYHVYPHGRYPAMLSNDTRVLYQQLSGLAATVLSWIESQLPAEIAENLAMPLADMITDSPRTLLRILNYPPLTGQEEEGAVRAAAHEDIDLITLLPAATTTGLQVQSSAGHWFDVPGDLGSIVINAGDMLQECTQGFYKSTTHQVVNPQGEAAKQSRLSMPLFLHPHDHIRLSERYTANSYLMERLKELGLY